MQTVSLRAFLPRAFLSFLALSILFISTQILASAKRPHTPDPSELTQLGIEERSLKIENLDRWFLVQPPADPKRAAPVLLVLHGGGQSMRRLVAGKSAASRVWPELALRENAILLVPNGVNSQDGDTHGDSQNWNDLREDFVGRRDVDDVGFLVALIDWAHQTYNTDRARVFVAGSSNGGMMTFRLLVEAPEKFTAAAAFIAALPGESSRLKKPARPTPLLLLNGTLDPLVKWQGGTILGNRGRTRSVPDTLAWWIEANNAIASSAPPEALPDLALDDECTIEQQLYPAAANGAPVLFYTVKGGGHSAPSTHHAAPNRSNRRALGSACRDVEAAELAWKFFQTSHLAPAPAAKPGK